MHRTILATLLLLFSCESASGGGQSSGPYDAQVAESVARLRAGSPTVRAGAAEALGFLRAYSAEAALVERLADRSPDVRRQAALALAWCGGRKAVRPLLGALDDEDWIVRQAAHVSLTNLTGMEFPFNSPAPPEKRHAQAERWRRWWATVPGDRPPAEVLKLLAGPKGLRGQGPVTTSSTYKGPPEVLLDGRIGPGYWQTKNVPFPQWCTVDLGQPREIARVAVHQYGPAFVMTEYELATSLDNKEFKVVVRRKAVTPVRLVIGFPKHKARYLRVTSYATKNPTYPTTFYEIEVGGANRGKTLGTDPVEWRQERGLRALGTLGGKGASRAILEVLGPAPTTASNYRPTIGAGIRSLGRLREEAGFEALLGLLENPFWARRAAEALGDFGDRRAVPALIAAYRRYAKGLKGQDPPDVPGDDRMGFPSEDRMLETPYWIAYALSRLPLDDPRDRRALGEIAPLIMANLPGDHDTFMLYEPEVGHRLTRYLMDRSGMRQQACEHALELLGQPRRVASPPDAPSWPNFPAYRTSSWLPAVCTEKEDLPRLLALLQHP
ncbi:MAG: HEAT repeat domain-containing protein, partial [Planctomycetota bacterium]